MCYIRSTRRTFVSKTRGKMVEMRALNSTSESGRRASKREKRNATGPRLPSEDGTLKNKPEDVYPEAKARISLDSHTQKIICVENAGVKTLVSNTLGKMVEMRALNSTSESGRRASKCEERIATRPPLPSE